jgi:hypothetical protein
MELLAMIFGGGATGLLGTLFSQIASFVDKAQERKFILEKYRLDVEIRSKEMESAEQVAEIKAYSDMLTASYLHDTSIGQGSQWVINFLRLVRPLLTILLWVMVGCIWISVVHTGETLPWLAEKSMTVQEQIIGTVLYSATAATLWWFGTRPVEKK